MVLEEDWDPDDNEDGDTSSIDTRFAHQVSNSGHGRLRRRFLDCLAGFAANKKGGAAVACSAMKETEDNVITWFSRNEGFSDVDKPAFEIFGKVLGSLSCNSGTCRMTASFLHAKAMLLSQLTNPRLICGKRWFYIIGNGLKAATFLI